MKLIDYFLLLVPDGVGDIFKDLRGMENLVGKSTDGQSRLQKVYMCWRTRYQALHRTHFRQQEVQQSPKLVQVILQGSARDEQTALGVVQPDYL